MIHNIWLEYVWQGWPHREIGARREEWVHWLAFSSIWRSSHLFDLIPSGAHLHHLTVSFYILSHLKKSLKPKVIELTRQIRSVCDCCFKSWVNQVDPTWGVQWWRGHRWSECRMIWLECVKFLPPSKGLLCRARANPDLLVVHPDTRRVLREVHVQSF